MKKIIPKGNITTTYIAYKHKNGVTSILIIPRSIKKQQASTITIKSPYGIAFVCQIFGVRDVRGQIPKSIYQALYLLPSDFPNNFSKTRSYLNRMKDC